MFEFDLILRTLIFGGLAGAGAAAGASRMFKAPEIQSMGSFRGLGEFNACNGDPLAHFSFGLGFLFSSAATTLAAGAMSQDVMHRIVPNWAAALTTLTTKDKEAFQNEPFRMGLYGAFIGAGVVTLLATAAKAIPAAMSTIASEILNPAANVLLNPIMPMAFWVAALSAGKWQGIFATIFGGFGTYIMGNGTPGAILGILIGQMVEDKGFKNKTTMLMIVSITIMFIAIAYFRGKLVF